MKLQEIIDTGQTLVKHWSNTDYTTGQTRVKQAAGSG
jgi:hypothetical protein